MAKTAFVAHSFTKEDEEHVRTFLDFLSGVSKVNPYFRWKHARDAEPRDVREKVLDVSADADFFIAICSKKERVFEPNKAKKTLFGGSRLVVEDGDCAWATSAWIVQEIGLALGRHIPVILLLESGVRNPGGMQGNLEYIEFDRTRPGDCFLQLTEMLGKLTVDGAYTDQDANLEASTPDGRDEALLGAPETRTEAPSEPADGMSLAELREGLFMACAGRDAALAGRFEAAFLKSQFGASEEARAEWSARQNWLNQIFFGKSDVALVSALSKKYPDNADVGTQYARLLNALGESDAAAKEFQRVSEVPGNDEQRVKSLCDAARTLTQSGEVDNALDMLRAAIDCLTDTARDDANSRAAIASVLGDALEPRDKFFKASLMEYVAELQPGDSETRFQLGYLYGDIPMAAQAMHNYLRIPESVRSPWAWNNLGVAFGNVGAKGKSVAAYQKAEEQGNHLATSNRAKLLRDAGFLDEAEQAVRSAILSGAEEPALAETLTSVVSQREEDDKTVAARREEAKKVEGTARSFGRALLTPAKFDWSGEWISRELTLFFDFEGKRLVGHGSYERPRGLRRLMLGNAVGDTNAETIDVRISADVVASGAFGSIERTVRGTNPTLLGGAGQNAILVWFDDAEGVLHLVERKSPTEFIDRVFGK